jgi:hypothetical protein
MVATLSGRAPLKGLTAAGLGLMVSMIGSRSESGTLRWTFDTLYLYDGVPLVPATLGLFAMPELCELAVSRKKIAGDHAANINMSSQWEGVTDHIDLFQLHGVPISAYGHARDILVPTLIEQKAKGKIRHIGITELATEDDQHEMLSRAAYDGLWDVVMIAFPYDASERPKNYLSADAPEADRHASHVRGEKHLCKTGAGRCCHARSRCERAG